VEIGHARGRTGCRTDEQALAVAKAATGTGTLKVAGVVPLCVVRRALKGALSRARCLGRAA
jgi:D-serine deaminase-like pyridoxal phosphate-dependent protein